MNNLPRHYARELWPEITFEWATGGFESREAETWIEYIGPFASRQLIVLMPSKVGNQARWQWLWNSSYTGILTDRPPNVVVNDDDARPALSDRLASVSPAPLTPEEFEAAWTASFVFLLQMTRLVQVHNGNVSAYCWTLPDFEGTNATVQIL